MPQDLFLKSFSDLMGLKPYFKNKIGCDGPGSHPRKGGGGRR